jgi:hypothetical protein
MSLASSLRQELAGDVNTAKCISPCKGLPFTSEVTGTEHFTGGDIVFLKMTATNHGEKIYVPMRKRTDVAGV